MAVKVTKWEVDEKALEEMLRQDGVGGYLRTAASAGLEYARSISPVVTGRYQDSLRLVEVRTEDGELVAGVGTDHWSWHWVEFGSVNNQPHRVLSQAATYVADHVEFM